MTQGLLNKMHENCEQKIINLARYTLLYFKKKLITQYIYIAYLPRVFLKYNNVGLSVTLKSKKNMNHFKILSD